MGYLVGTVCYGTVGAAADAYFSSIPRFSLPVGGSSDVIEVSWMHTGMGPSGWTRYEVRWPSGNPAGLSVVSSLDVGFPGFASCNPATAFLDGVSIGWGIAAAMVAAVSFKLLRRALT